jgi:hypothetical protein
MRADQFADDVRNTWQTQTPVMTPLTSSLLRRAARRFDRKSRRGGLFDLVGFVALVLFFCVVACWGEVTLCRIGCALIAIGISYSAYHRIRGGWMDWLPSERATGCLSFYRAQLTRRRDLSQIFPAMGHLAERPGRGSRELRMDTCRPTTLGRCSRPCLVLDRPPDCPLLS